MFVANNILFSMWYFNIWNHCLQLRIFHGSLNTKVFNPWKVTLFSCDDIDVILTQVYHELAVKPQPQAGY